MNREDARALLHSAITFGEDLPPGAIDRLGGQAVYRLMTAAVIVAVSRKFPEGTPPEEIALFAEGLPGRFPTGGDQVRPKLAEDVIAAMRGEDERIKPYDFNEIMGALFILAYAIMSHANLDEDGFERYLAEVFDVVERELS